MTCKTVLDNRDPLRMGRVLVDSGWIHPICAMECKFLIPCIGALVVVYGMYYIGESIC
jgi:hypothetical protein